MCIFSSYINDLSLSYTNRFTIPNACLEPEQSLIGELSLCNSQLWDLCGQLSDALMAEDITLSMQQRARYYRDTVFCLMEQARVVADHLETITAAKYWPFPTYAELLFQG